MIRVNLLPQKKEARRAASEGSPMWLAFVLGAIVVESVALAFWWKLKTDQLTKITKQNQEAQANIDEIKHQTSNHDDIKKELKELRDREDAIQKLQSARTGPTATLLELSHVLTPGRGPTVDRDKLEQLKRDNPSAVPNPNWDPRRLWLKSYSEVERTVRLHGLARDGEDVSEFLRRLALSDYFYDVRLLPGTKSTDGETHLELVNFELSAKVRY
jgi:type IV pilus assembly protein PilN